MDEEVRAARQIIYRLFLPFSLPVSVNTSYVLLHLQQPRLRSTLSVRGNTLVVDVYWTMLSSDHSSVSYSMNGSRGLDPCRSRRRSKELCHEARVVHFLRGASTKGRVGPPRQQAIWRASFQARHCDRPRLYQSAKVVSVGSSCQIQPGPQGTDIPSSYLAASLYTLWANITG